MQNGTAGSSRDQSLPQSNQEDGKRLEPTVVEFWNLISQLYQLRKWRWKDKLLLLINKHRVQTSHPPPVLSPAEDVGIGAHVPEWWLMPWQAMGNPQAMGLFWLLW